MLTIIAIMHFTIPGFAPKNPPIHPPVTLPRPVLCHNSSCMGGPIR